MGASVYHVRTATTPDSGTDDIMPSHWNSLHAITLNAVGSEISGAFSNTPGGVTFGLETNGKITAGAPAGGGGITAVNFSAGTTSNNASAWTFNNSNGVSFGLNGSVITATVATNYLTTARASNDAVGLNTALTAGPLAWTVNSSGISLNAGSAAGTTSGFSGNQISGSMTHNTAGLALSLNHPAWLTTAMASNAATISNINVSAGTTSNNLSALTFNNSNGVSFGLNGSVITATVATNYQSQGAYLTTARASNDAVGLNTAQSNVTWTVNSSGISLDGRGYAGTGTSATNASVTLNSNGLQISVAAGGGVTPVASASNGSFSFTTLAFSNANNVTFGTSAGSIVTASVAAPGAAAENNWFTLQGNVSGNSSASGSTIALSAGNNVTLSGTNGSVIRIDAPGSSSLSAVSPVYISTNASTISVGLNPVSNYAPFPLMNNTSFSTFGQNTLYLQFIQPELNLNFSNIDFMARGSFVSSTNNQAHSQTISYGLYSQDANNTSRMSRVGSSSIGISVAYSSNTSGAYTFSGNGTSMTAASGGTALFTNISGPLQMYLPYAGTVGQNVKCAIAMHISTKTAGGTSPFRFAPLVMTAMNSLSFAKISMGASSAPNASNYADWEMVAYSATTNAFPATIALSELTINVSRQKLWFELEV